MNYDKITSVDVAVDLLCQLGGISPEENVSKR